MTVVSPEAGDATRRHLAPRGMRRRKTRPNPDPNRGWGWRYALLAYLVVLVSDFVIAAVLPRQALRIGIGSLTLDAVMLAALIQLYRALPFTARDLGLRLTAPARAVGLTFAGLVAYFAIAAFWVLLVIGQHRRQVTPQLHTGTAGTVIAGLAACCVAPVTEELFFRGLLYRALRNRLTVTWSVVIVAVLFAAAHASTYPADTLPIKAAFAIVTCLLYERTGSLYPGIALHCLVDSTGYEASISHGQIWIAPAAYAAFALAVLARHRFRAPPAAQVTHPRPQSDRTARISDALIVRFGYHSPRRVMASAGGLMVFAAFVALAATGPYAHHQHAARGGLIGLVFILGLLMIVAAILWRVFQRPDRR